MVYEVKSPTEYFGGANVEGDVAKLVNDWLLSAEALAATAKDDRSRRFDLVRRACTEVYTVEPWDGAALTQLVDDVINAARETLAEDNKLAERLTAVVGVIKDLQTQVPESKPGDDDEESRPNAWDTLAEQLDRQFAVLVGLLREQGSVLAMMLSCQQVLGQLLNRIGSHADMLLLVKDGELVALALLEGGGGVGDLLVKPAHLADGARGAGSALMEYIVRWAKVKGQTVSLIPLDSSALRVYIAWGFTGDMRGMVLKSDAAERLIGRYTSFAGHVFQ
ncbi:hypothetical protein [Streptomyces sp. NPDC059389]|uniref:hypothetical protein n=1 Tax=Streptomyces sp. NPDC059389 TaxID=3346818 RepID=UPI003694D779